MSLLGEALRRALFTLDPETAHQLAIRGLALGLHRPSPPDPRLQVRVLGLDFPSPIGLAAGFDKNAVAVDGLLNLGFGFVEVGTVTPRPQPGNPRPRMFRLEADRAIINRLGFNNDGHAAVAARLRARAGKAGIVGVNIGANRDSADRVADYVAGVAAFADLASYLALNVSSPNTPGLRDLQEKRALTELLARVLAARDDQTRRPPVLLKVAPDLDDASLAAIVETALSAGIDGLIATNTTIARDGLRPDPDAAQAGGLSGPPLFARSTAILRRLRELSGPDLPLIGVGGVEDAESAAAKLAAGADLVQVYTGFIYGGHRIADAINRGLAAQRGGPDRATGVAPATSP